MGIVCAVVVRNLRSAEKLNMIDFQAVCSSDVLLCERLADGPGVLGQLIDIFDGQYFSVLFYEVEPIAAPRDVSIYLAMPGHVDRNRNTSSKTGDVFDGDFA